MRSLGIALGLAVVCCFGCSSDDDGDTGEAIDCSWFTAPNCWTEVVDAAYACTNDADGTFDAARSRCTAPDVTVAFATPVPIDLFEDDAYRWNFTVSRGGTECVHLVETEGGIEVKSSAGQFRETLQGTTMVLHCPDGTRYSIDAFAALGCGFDALPGYSYVESLSTLSYDLSREGDRGTSSLFTCRSDDSTP